MIVVIVAVLCGVWAGVVASNRGGSGFWWFVGGCLLAILFVPLAYTVGKECGGCRKKIHREASLCPHCMTRQTSGTDSVQPPATDPTVGQMNARELEVYSYNPVAARDLCRKRLRREVENSFGPLGS